VLYEFGKYNPSSTLRSLPAETLNAGFSKFMIFHVWLIT